MSIAEPPDAPAAAHPAGALPGRLTLQEFASPAALAEAVAAAVQAAVTGGVAERGTASLVLTGGTTPQHYLPTVGALPLPWERVAVTLSDDRRVAVTHPDSNAGLLARCLLRGNAAQAHFVGLVDDPALDDAAAVARAEAGLRALPRPFDLVLLGLGADSHIASLFPGAAGVAEALDPAGSALCCAVTPPDGVSPPLPRISLTLAALLGSRRIVIAAQGAGKRDAFVRAADGAWPLPSPVHALALHARQPVDFCWCP